MTRAERPWLWRCPHCLGGNMTLVSAEKHLRRKHSDCWSCKLERMMVMAMMSGRGFVFEGDPFRRLTDQPS